MPIIKPSEAWTEADALRAMAEGWKLEPTRYTDKYKRDRIRWLIESIDSPKGHGEIISHVVHQAGKGYPLYLKALILHGTGADVELLYVPTGLMS